MNTRTTFDARTHYQTLSRPIDNPMWNQPEPWQRIGPKVACLDIRFNEQGCIQFFNLFTTGDDGELDWHITSFAGHATADDMMCVEAVTAWANNAIVSH